MASVVARDGEDVVELTVINGLTLVLSPPERGRPAARAGARRHPRRSRDHDAGALVVKAQLGWPGLEAAAGAAARHAAGWARSRSAFKVLTGFQADAATLVASMVTKKIDGKVVEGVYKLPPDWQPGSPHEGHDPRRRRGAGGRRRPAAGAGAWAPSSTRRSTFGKLWLQPDKVRTLFDRYKNRVYALDYPTVGKSLIGNALALVRALPAGARLHLLTHPRGGLVAEVLARPAAAPRWATTNWRCSPPTPTAMSDRT